MNNWTKILISCLIGYAIGEINPSFILAKVQGFDIRKKGSRNAGGSNAIITMGKGIGALCCIFDIMKAFIAIRLCEYLFPDVKFVFASTAVACILGHMFPIYMQFKGGKGLACLGGTILAYSPIIFCIMLACELLIALIIDYICFVPVTASIAFPVVYGLCEKDIYAAFIFAIPAIVMFIKHTENFRRIRQGTELHLSYIWKKEEEQERITENIRKIDETQVNTVWRNK